MRFSSVLLALLSSSKTAAAFSIKSARVPSAASSAALSSSRIFSSSTNDEETVNVSKDKAPRHAPRHDAGTQIEISAEEKEVQAAFAKHQQNCPKLGYPEDVRTLVEYNHGFAVMSTHSKATEGYPNGSVVGFAPDEDGSPFFVFSGLATHTQDVLVNPKCSLTVASKQFKGLTDGRVNLMGQVKLVPPEEREALKSFYLKKHPGAFWVDFGDFNWFKMDIEKIYYVGGFGRIVSITPEEYKQAKPDAISAFGAHIASHMNDDHMDSTIAIIESQVPGLNPSEAIITSVDSLGMYVKITRSPAEDSEQKQTFKMRLPFPRQANDRKDVKDVIVEMTRAAAPTSQ